MVHAAVGRFRRNGPAADVDLVVIGPRGTEVEGASFLDVGPWDGTEAGAGSVTVEALRKAVELGRDGHVHAFVTGPAHKPALHAAGYPFPGQTELLRELAGASRVGMLMAAEETRLGPPLRVLLATTHLPLREVPDSLTPDLLVEQATLLDLELRRGWGLAAPRLALCGLNPHASDGGLFGDEEERIFAPAVERLRSQGGRVTGPLPADTVFHRAIEGEFDAVVTPYHDVGMSVFKTLSFRQGVNVTLGLPVPRTSPDHGTAFDLAGQGKADASSTVSALRLALRLARSRFDTPPTRT